jgi:dTMP kinase
VSGSKGDRQRRAPHQPIVLAPDLRRSLDEVMRDHVRMVLDACDNNQTHAAKVLGVDRKTLSRSLERWGIKVRERTQFLQPGSLIVIEGLDGAGITTQAKRLASYLDAHGHRALYTEQPSNGPIGKLLRTLLASPDRLAHQGAMRTLSLLFAADRVDHYHRVVAPALEQGITVVSDRWYHSSLAYQRTGVDREWIMDLNRPIPPPDVTVMLEVRPEVGQQRRRDAGRAPERFHDPAVQREVVAGYRATIAELRLEGEHIVLVDGEQPEAEVAGAVVRAVGAKYRRA